MLIKQSLRLSFHSPNGCILCFSTRKMDKVIHSDKNITPFGGLNFIYDAISRSGIDSFIDQQMGQRSLLAQYSYSDIVLSLFGNALCQGSFVSDLEGLKEKFSNQVFNKIPSPDTVEYVCQELKTQNLIHITDTGVVHQLNYDTSKNETLVALAVKTNQLSAKHGGYTLDFDNVITENQKQDALYTYKHSKGYHPNLAFIDRIPVHIENHNGNTPARYQQKQTLERCFKNLAKSAIKIKNFRGDSASYQKEVIELAATQAEFFFIRMMDFEDIREYCGEVENWNTVAINYHRKEVASILYKPFKGEKEYRIVVTRKLKKDGQIDLLSGSAYDYYGIITNNYKMTEQEVIEFYNQRGDAENSNRYMLNDFNLHHLPFPDMDTNTVYMYLMALCATLFEWIKMILIKNKTQGITTSLRIKAVCFHYVMVATIFVNHARQKILKVFSQKHYCILKI